MTDGTRAAGGAARAARPDRPGPPPRPPVTSSLPPPAPRVAPRRPGAVRLSAWCWVASVLAGCVALAAAALDLAGIRQRLQDAGAAADPSASADLLRSGADTTVAGVLIGIAALVVLTVGCLLLFVRRARWRGGLVTLGVLTIGVDVLAQDLLAGGPEVDRGAVLVQAGLVVLAVVLLFLPASRAWARGATG